VLATPRGDAGRLRRAAPLGGVEKDAYAREHSVLVGEEGLGVDDLRVLIVDDQQLYRSALADLLEIGGGFDVVAEAGSGEEAVEIATASGLDLVFMDLRLPGLDGVAATTAVRATADPPEVVVISTDAEALGSDEVRRSGALVAVSKEQLEPAWLDRLRDDVRRARPPR
jgi:DNA-binding NarL/FixJ family response regulator